jgi:hypothetical protein
MATKNGAVSAPEKAKQKPAHEIRLGRIRCTLWANFHDEKGTWYSMTFARSYKDGDEWRNATSFGRDDLLTVAEAARMAWHWIYRNSKKASQNGAEPTDETPPDSGQEIPF